jgi:type IV pilus assembly protein PilY1
MVALNLQVAASVDDCIYYENAGTPLFDASNTTQNAGRFDNTSYRYYGGGVRFQNVTIPKGAVIKTAVLKVTAMNGQSGTVVNTRITGDAEDNAAAWSDITNYKNRRGTLIGGANNNYITSHQVDWNGVPAFVLDTEYTSPDISTVIQEIVNRAGWASGHALALWWDDYDRRSTLAGGDNRRSAYSYDFIPSKSAKLQITYTLPPAGGIALKLMAAGI